MSDLQDLIAQTPAGGTVDLGSATWTIGSDDPDNDRPCLRLKKPFTLIGDGAEIHVTRSRTRDRKTLRVRGPNVQLLGDVTIVHDDYLDGNREDLEGQSGIEFQGATDFVCDWKVHAAAGTNYYFGRDPVAGTPCQRGTMTGIVSSRAGRQHMAFQCIDGLTIIDYTWDSLVAGTQHSASTFEPNGHLDLMKNVVATNGVLMGDRAWSFSSSSEYPHQPMYALDNVVFDGLTSPDLPLTAKLGSPPGTRKHGFVARDWHGHSELHRAGFVMQGVDGLVIENYRQRCSGIAPEDLFDTDDCPDATLTLAVVESPST